MSSTVTNAYLAELTLALRILPVEVRREIHSGIAEELRGLDDGAASQRIGELGDPKYVAAAALDEVDAGEGHAVAAPKEDKTWYTLSTVLALIFGGLVLPFFGWFGGVVLLWNSKTWTVVDKIIGTVFVPFGATTSILVLMRYGRRSMTTEMSLNGGPVVIETEYFGTPWIWALAYIVAALPFVSAIYLVVRAALLKKTKAQS